MSDKSDLATKIAVNNASNANTRNFVPFTGGLCFVLYAFFWPESYGHWLGTIVHSFRTAAGF